MYRTAYSRCYTKGDSPVIGGIERLRVKDKTLRQEPPRSSQQMDSEVKDIQGIADKGEDSLTRKELGALFGVTHEAIRIWEENGKLIELGWERIPHIKSPVKYSRTSQPVAPVPPVSPQD